MKELFPNVPNYVRRQTEFWVDMASRADSLIEALKIIKNYIDTLDDEENKNYVMFAFTIKMESIKNESNND